MNRSLGLLTTVVIVLAAGGMLSAQDPSSAASAVSSPKPVAQAEPAKVPVVDTSSQPEKIPGGMEGFISLDLRSIDIIEALKFFSLKAGLDVVTTKNVAGRVTLMVENVPVKDVFDIMLRSNKLAYDKTGKIYNVMTEDEYKALYGKSFADTRVVATFRLLTRCAARSAASLSTRSRVTPL
jgi:hypothetical protein